MGYIDNLLCGRKVEWKTLGEVAKIRNGKDYKHLSVGSIPVYGSGGVMRYVDTPIYDQPTVLIPRKGSLNNLFYVDSPFWNVDTIFYTEINREIIRPKFLYHYLSTLHLEGLNLAGGVPSLTQKTLNALPIPLPPLDVQEEIVRILDRFSALEAELEAALKAEQEARQKQYEYYRNRLLSAEGIRTMYGEAVKPIALGDLGQLVRGSGLQRKDLTASGVPAIHYGQIYTYYGAYTTHTIAFVSPETARSLKKVNYGDVIITNTSENVEDVNKAVAYLVQEEGVTGGHATIFKPAKGMLGQYLAYYTQTQEFFNLKRRYARGTKVIDVSASDLAKITIPLPSLHVQERIVRILDKFTALTTSLTAGLPGEIALRRRQYEYYREQLLTFE